MKNTDTRLNGYVLYLRLIVPRITNGLKEYQVKGNSKMNN